MLFRHATEADLPAIAAIYAHYVLHTTASFETEPPDVAEIARRRQAVLDLALPWLVAEADGAVTGYAYATLYRPRRAYRFTVEDSIYIHRDHAGKGLGAELLGRLIQACETWGARQMIAVIGSSDNIASIKLHTRFGFRHAATLTNVGYKFDRWVDSVLMQRPIGTASVPISHNS
jgi:phosphinothricin acetyltransferase